MSVGNFLVKIANASMYSLRHLSFGFASSSSLLSPIKDTFALESWVTPNLWSRRPAQWSSAPQIYLFIQAHLRPLTKLRMFMKPSPPRLFLVK